MYHKNLLVPTTIIDTITKKYRSQLLKTIRYARFMANETSDEWLALLGPDVIGLTHPKVVVDIVNKFISYNQKHKLTLKPEEKVILITAAWVHDWGELIIEGQGVGDISYDQKTKADEECEITIFKTILQDISDQPIKNFIEKSYLDIVGKKNHKLSAMFTAIERIGYLKTAIVAYQGCDNKRIENWRGLISNVLSNQIEALIQNRVEYPYVGYFLQQVKPTITHMFDQVITEQVICDVHNLPMYDRDKLEKAYHAWTNQSNS